MLVIRAIRPDEYEVYYPSHGLRIEREQTLKDWVSDGFIGYYKP